LTPLTPALYHNRRGRLLYLPFLDGRGLRGRVVPMLFNFKCQDPLVIIIAWNSSDGKSGMTEKGLAAQPESVEG
jgi:hypothetical protein